MHEPNPTNRREFVERVAAGALALGVGAAASPASALASTALDNASSTLKPDNSWLAGIKGNHAQIFDMPAPNGAFPLFHVRNYMRTYKDAWGLTYPNVLSIVSLYGMTVPMAFNDKMWAKYGFGAATQSMDRATKAPAVRNVFAIAEGGIVPGSAAIDIPGDASIAALQSVGTRFILCDNAYNFWVARLAAGMGGNAKDIRADLDANMLPHITLVPAMVIAFNQAQAAGASYMFLP